MFSDGTQKRRIVPQRTYKGIMPGYYSPTRFNQQAVRDRYLAQYRPVRASGGEQFGVTPAEQADISRGRYEINPGGQLVDNWAVRGQYLTPVTSGAGQAVYPTTPTPKLDTLPGERVTPTPTIPTVPTVPGQVYPTPTTPKYDTLPGVINPTVPTAPVVTAPTVPTSPVVTTPTVRTSPVVTIVPKAPATAADAKLIAAGGVTATKVKR